MLLDCNQLASYLKVNKSWVYEAVKAEKIPVIRVGRYLRFDLNAVLGVLSESASSSLKYEYRKDVGHKSQKEDLWS